jgi:outer membrane receptor protein involved in Fe transport
LPSINRKSICIVQRFAWRPMRMTQGFLQMTRSTLLASAAVAALLASTAGAFAQTAAITAPDSSGSSIETVVVTAKKLSDARAGIQTQIGASVYAITAQDIQDTPGGDNTLLNQVILQMPSVAQDSYGQFHIRGEHNALQYRLDGITLPEGISVFGQTLDPRLASSVELITGALPAEYGLATGGIIDIKPKTGLFDDGGTISMYGGSHNELAPSFDYGGSTGSLNYFVSGDYMTNGLGIESPDGSSTPIHDRTEQYHGFAYLEDIIDDNSSITAILGTSHDHFEIPNTAGLTPGLGLTDINDPLGGGTTYPSAAENETQREITDYAILSYLHSQGAFDFQISAFGRFSSLNFAPDQIGDLLYNGIAQSAYKKDVALGEQAEAAWHLGDSHTIRGGVIIENDRLTSNTTSSVLPEDCTTSGTGPAGTPTNPYSCAPYPSSTPGYNVPETIIDNSGKTQWTESVYLQDEWKVLPDLTVNYGLRYDNYTAYSSGDQLSPRLNAVYKPWDGTTFHLGYARYFSPPPFELVGNQDIAKFSPTPANPTAGTSATPQITTDTTPVAERANYFDAGAQQQVMEGLLVGIDTYYKLSRDMIDEGQFGAPIVLTPFNYAKGRQYGAELTADYTTGNFNAYGNLSLEHAIGEGWVSSQFSFLPDQFLYTQNHYIDLDHEQHFSASGGASYKWGDTLFDTDLIYGTGLREDTDALPGLPDGIPNGTHVPAYLQVNAGLAQDFSAFGWQGFTARFDVINLFDEKYEIRSGSGVGVFAPQWGPRRGVFVGLSKAF